MPSTAMPAAILSVSSSSCGCAWPSSAARRRTSSVSSSSRHGGAQSRCDRLERALVGDRERADLLDVVAPELHPQRVLLGGREDVDDAAADGELAAPLDHVDAGVRRVGQAAHDLLERPGVARGQLDRLDVGEARRPAAGAGCGSGATTTLSGPLAASVPGWRSRRRTASRRPTVSLRGLSRSCGQRLPARVVGDGVGVDEVGELLDEVLGLARGRGDRQDRAPALDQAVHHERPHRAGPGEVEGGLHRGVGQRATQGGAATTRVGDGGEGRGRHRGSLREHAEEPPHERTVGEDESLRVLPDDGCGGRRVCPVRHRG